MKEPIKITLINTKVSLPQNAMIVPCIIDNKLPFMGMRLGSDWIHLGTGKILTKVTHWINIEANQ